IAIIDRNGFQLSGHTEEIKIKEPIKKKFESFGWYTIEINNNLNELILSLELMSEIKGLPKAIIVKSMQSFR
ncbi:MAG: hypothetical protein RAK17_04565, partial [Caldisphaera sp.]|nr:hypothetical protein [Caldisphaera sp.]